MINFICLKFNCLTDNNTNIASIGIMANTGINDPVFMKGMVIIIA